MRPLNAVDGSPRTAEAIQTLYFICKPTPYLSRSLSLEMQPAPATPEATTNCGRLVVNPPSLFTRPYDIGTNIYCLRRHSTLRAQTSDKRPGISPFPEMRPGTAVGELPRTPDTVQTLYFIWKPIPHLSGSLSLEAQPAPMHLRGRGLP